MTFKDFVYIGLIVIALIIGYISHPAGESNRIQNLEDDVKLKQLSINKLKISFDSLAKIVIVDKARIKKDSIDNNMYRVKSSAAIKNLTNKIYEINFSSYSDDQLDSLINNLYNGPNTLLPARNGR